MAQAYSTYQQMIKEGRYVEAVSEAEAAYLKGRPDDPFWLTRQAAALVRTGRHEQALVVARQAFALAPADPFCLLAMAEAQAGLQKHEEAAAFYEEAARAPKLQPYARKRLLGCLMAMHAYERLELLLAGWDLPAAERLAWEVKLLRLRGRNDQALEACRRRLELLPDDAATLWDLTELEIAQQGLEPVLARMGRLAKIASRPPIYKEIYASLCRRAGKTDAAIAQYAQLTQTGADPRIQRRHAFVLAKSGREHQAIPMMEELLRLQPDDVYVHSAYRAACRRAGQLPRALDFYKALIALHPARKNLFGRLRGIQKELGDRHP